MAVMLGIIGKYMLIIGFALVKVCCCNIFKLLQHISFMYLNLKNVICLFFRVCVGIQVPPDSNDWFCRVCIGKKDELVGEKKKKMRKKKSVA